MNKNLFNQIYNEGKKSGLLHFEPGLPTKDNEAKIKTGIISGETRIKAYWLGYKDGMEIIKKSLTV